jgi:hypothetical protein
VFSDFFLVHVSIVSYTFDFCVPWKADICDEKNGKNGKAWGLLFRVQDGLSGSGANLFLLLVLSNENDIYSGCLFFESEIGHEIKIL